MIIIIDAYNVIKQLYPQLYITEHQRTIFIQQLERYAKKRGHVLIVVFDGGLHGIFQKILYDRVTVIYTGAQERADDYIIRYIQEHAAQDVLVISTDREITARAVTLSLPTLDAAFFYTYVRAALAVQEPLKKKSSQVHKLQSENNPELDMLMESIEVFPQAGYKDMPLEKNRLPASRQVSKQERRMQKILSKL